MIQFNLLPDVKLEYIRARRVARLVFGVSSIIVAVSVAILMIVLTIGLAQGKHLSDLNRDITKESNDLKKKPQIDRILTVQNQLERLTELHDGKPAATRTFDYLNQVTPVDVSISSCVFDYVGHTATITGAAKALSSVNTYVDTLKFTTYQEKGSKDTPNAFSKVVLTAFAVGDPSAIDPVKKQATYTIALAYDPLIFTITKSIKLHVPPGKITTRSELEKPTDLFVKQSAPRSTNSTPTSSSSTTSITPQTTGGNQ